MSVILTPSKRQQDGNLGEPDGKGKLQKVTGSYSHVEPLKSSSSSAEFRVLCPVSKISSVVGEDASFVSQIQLETGAKVRVEELVPGSDEQVIKIGFDKENEADSEHRKRDGDKEANVDEKQCGTEKQSGNMEDKDSDPNESLKSEKGCTSLQTALLLVFDRMVVGENGEEKKSLTFVLRLLVPSSQVGCILGKGGSVIKQMSSESGAQIRIVPRDKIPPCVSASDELVQITGDVDAVRKALRSITLQLLGNPSRGLDSFPANNMVPSSNLHSQPRPRSEGFPQMNRSFGAQGAVGPRDVDYHSAVPPLIPKFREGGFHGRMKPSQEILSFRLLCHAERLGGVIGKGGQVIRTVQQDTGCDVKILEGMPDSVDRIIVVSGPVHPDDRISAVQDAVLRVQSRIARALPDSKEQGVTARLLVSSNQIGYLLGKGGSVIAEMRKLSRAHIRVLGKDLIPKCALEDEEVVQINGEFEAVQEGLVQITTRLQHHFFRDAYPSINFPPNPPFFYQPPYPSFLGRRELSPPGMYSNYGPPFHKFDAVDFPPPQGFHPRDDRAPFMHNIPRFGGPPHISDRRHWGPQGLIEGGGPGLPDFVEGPQRRTAGFAGGNHPAVITSTTVEVVVPRSVVPEIYGEDGECLRQIREISDAKITITEPKPGAVETVILIYGTPEQTHAAQSLIQAFVISETEST